MSGEPSPLDPGCAGSGARGVPENMRNSGRGEADLDAFPHTLLNSG